MNGSVNVSDEPYVSLEDGGQTYSAIIDTGFNGDLELPNDLRAHVNPRFKGKVLSLLAAGQQQVCCWAPACSAGIGW